MYAIHKPVFCKRVATEDIKRDNTAETYRTDNNFGLSQMFGARKAPNEANTAMRHHKRG